MLTAARKIVASTKNCDLDRYRQDEELRLTVERRLEIIGEAARRLSSGLRAKHPEIPWRLIIAQRNVLIHEYDEIAHERIWLLAREELPALVAALEKIAPPEGPAPGGAPDREAE